MEFISFTNSVFLRVVAALPLNGLWYLNGGLFTVVGWRLDWLAGLWVDGGGHMIPRFEGSMAALLSVILAFAPSALWNSAFMHVSAKFSIIGVSTIGALLP